MSLKGFVRFVQLTLVDREPPRGKEHEVRVLPLGASFKSRRFTLSWVIATPIS